MANSTRFNPISSYDDLVQTMKSKPNLPIKKKKKDYEFGDITKGTLSTVGDIATNVGKGFLGATESVVDLGRYGVAGVADLLGADKYANDVRRRAMQDTTGFLTKPADDLYNKRSVLKEGGLVEGVSQGVGQVGAMIGGSTLLPGAVSTVNVGKFALPTSSILMGAGGGMTEAYNSGANDLQALGYGLTKGAIEGGTEAMFGGLGKTFNKFTGGGALDEVVSNNISKKLSGVLTKKGVSNVTNRVLTNLVNAGVMASGEGIEEVVSSLLDPLAKKIYSDKSLKEMYKDQNLMQDFIVGALTSGILQAPGTITNIQNGNSNVSNGSLSNQTTNLDTQKPNIPTVQDIVAQEQIKNNSQLTVPNIESKNVLQSNSQVMLPTTENIETKYITKAEEQELQEFEKSDDLLDEEELQRYEYLQGKKEQSIIGKDLIGKTSYDKIKNVYGKYKNLDNFDSKPLDKVNEIITPNKSGRKTKEQWLDTANMLGNNLKDMNPQELEKYAIQSFFYAQPNQKDNLNRQGKKYVKFTMEEWLDSFYKGANVGGLNYSEPNLPTKATVQNSLQEQPTQMFQYVKSDNTQVNTLNESIAKYFDNSQKTQDMSDTIAKIVKDKGYTVEFDDTITAPNGNFVNALVSADGKTIKLNPNSPRAVEFLLIHEMTHSIETKEMRNLVLDYAQKNPEFNQAIENLKKTYGTDDVSAEVVADISGQLFGNQEFINNLSMEKPNVFKRIYAKIVEIANKLTGNSNEALFMRDLKNKWETAYRTQNKGINSDTQYSETNDLKAYGIEALESRLKVLNEQADKLQKEGNKDWIDFSNEALEVEAAIEDLKQKNQYSMQENLKDFRREFNAKKEVQDFIRDNNLTVEKLADNKELRKKYYETVGEDINFLTDSLDYYNYFKDEMPRVLKGLEHDFNLVKEARINELTEKLEKISRFDAEKASERAYLREQIDMIKDGFKGTSEEYKLFKEKQLADKIARKNAMAKEQQEKLAKANELAEQKKLQEQKEQDEIGKGNHLEINGKKVKIDSWDESKNYQSLRPNPRGGWTIEKIQKQLKGEHSGSNVSVKELNEFDSIDDIMDNIYYHGSTSRHTSLKAGSTIPESQRTGGYDQEYHSISLSKSKDMASRFTGQERTGNVTPVLLKKGAKVLNMPKISDSVELEDYLPELWNKKVDAVKIDNFDEGFGEQELVILNPNCIAQIPDLSENFQVYNKKKFDNLSKAEIKEFLTNKIEKVKASDTQGLLKNRINELENKMLNDVQYSMQESPVKDNKGRELSKGQQEFFKDVSDEVKDEEGNLKELYHGTATGEFNVFDKTFGNPEGDFGKGFYFTDNLGDVEKNYEGGGSDFDSKVGKLAEKIADEEGISYEQAKEKAHNELFKGSHKFTVYLNIKNPAVVGETKLLDLEGYQEDINSDLEDETSNYEEDIIQRAMDDNGLDSEDDISDEMMEDARNEVLEENGLKQEIIERYLEDDIDSMVNSVSFEYDLDEDQLRQILWNEIFENEGIDIATLKERINNEMEIADEEGNLAGNEVVRSMIESLGYDGIVDNTVSEKFSNMGIEPGTTHYIVFNPEQIKRIDNLNPTGSNDIRYSQKSQTWQEHLEKNYKTTGTRTYTSDILPTKETTTKVETVKLPTKKTLNPIEISNMTKEDVSTTPILPTKNVKVGEGKSKFAKNIKEKTNMLTEESKKAILSDEAVQSYEKVTNKDSLEKAFDRLNKGGKTETLNWLAKDSTNADSVDVAEGWILLNQYQNEIQNEKNAVKKDELNRSMVQVAKKMRDMGTKAGQAVQAFNILNRLTPEGMVYYAQAELQEAFEKAQKGKTKEWIDQYKDNFELNSSETQFIMDTMKEIQGMPDGYDKKVKLAEIQKVMTDKLPPSKGAGLKAWMRISMLFNPKTQVRNVLGNAVVLPVNYGADLIGSAIDKQIAKKTGIRTTGSDYSSYKKGFKEGVYQSYNDFRKGINTRNIEGNRFEISEGKSFNDNTKIGKALNRVDNLLGFMLDAGDRGFYEASFVSSLNNQMALNNATKPTQDMIEIATNEALARTWQDNNNYTKFVLNIRRGLNAVNVKGYGLGDVLIPFAKTPANLTKAIVDYSPVGLVNSINKGVNLKRSLSNGQFTPQMQKDFVSTLGKATAGSLLYVLGMALAKAKITTGESDDDKDVANFLRNTLGIDSYSIKIGNKSYKYDWAQPIAAPFAITANLANKESKNLKENIVSTIDTGLNVLFEQSFLDSMSDVLSKPGEIGTKMVEQILDLPSRAVPTFLKQISDMIDSTQRSSFEYDKPLETAKNKIKSKIPFLTKDLAPSVDTLGRDIEKYGGKNNIFNVFLNPANVRTGNISESAREIYDLYQATGDKTIMPRVAPFYINQKGDKIVLTAKEKSQFQTISGKIIDKNVAKLLNNETYNALDDEKKAEIVKDIVDYSYNKAREEVVGIPMSSQYNKIEKYVEDGGTPAKYYTNKEEIDYSYSYPEKYATITQITTYPKFKKYDQEIKEIKNKYNNTKDRQTAVIQYVNSLNLSVPKKAMLIKSNYSSFRSYDSEIINYINNKNISKDEKIGILTNLGFKVRNGRVYR